MPYEIVMNMYGEGVDGQPMEDSELSDPPPRQAPVRDILDLSESKTEAFKDNVFVRTTPFVFNTYILDFTSLDGTSIAMPTDIEVLDPIGGTLSPGSQLDDDKSYIVLPSMGEYKVHRNGSFVQKITVSPPFPCVQLPL